MAQYAGSIRILPHGKLHGINRGIKSSLALKTSCEFGSKQDSVVLQS